MLSQSAKYALRGVFFLALNSSVKKKFSPKEIADTIDIPAPFLAKTLQHLAKHNIISSIKGRNGGFYLTEEDKQNSVIKIIDCIDGLDKFNSCFLGLPSCNDEKPCAIHHLITPLRRNLIEEFSRNSIEEFTRKSFLANEYAL